MIPIFTKIRNILNWTSTEFAKDYCFQKAAALTFATVFALIPVLGLSFSMFTSFTSFNSFYDKVQSILIKHFLPSTSSTISDYIALYTQNTAALSIASIIILIITSITLFYTIEHSFNSIFKIKSKRPIIYKIAYMWSILTFTPLLIATSIFLSTSIRTQPFIYKIIHIPILEYIYTNLIPLILTWITFFLAYQQIPNKKINPTISLLSALIAGTFWEFAKYGFDLYIANVPNYHKIYGSLGIIPVFLLWIYYSWLVVLFGAELTYILHKPYKAFNKKSSFYFPEIIAINIIYQISHNLIKDDKPTTLQDLYDKIDADEFFIKKVLNFLYLNKIIVKLDSELESYFLAKQLEHLRFSEILKIFKGSIISFNEEDFNENKLSEFLYEIKSEITKITEKTTIKDIMTF